MAGSVVVLQLSKQYARLLGQYRYAERQAESAVGIQAMDEAYFRIGVEQEKLRKRMARLAGSIREFDPDFEVGCIQPKYPRMKGVRPGTYSRPIYGVLRGATDPMTTWEIARMVADVMGLGQRTVELERTYHRVYATLMPRVGKMVRLIDGKPMRWELMLKRADRSVAQGTLYTPRV